MCVTMPCMNSLLFNKSEYPQCPSTDVDCLVVKADSHPSSLEAYSIVDQGSKKQQISKLCRIREHRMHVEENKTRNESLGVMSASFPIL